MPLRAQGIAYRYPGASADAVCDTSLDLHRGELVLLLGANGSGKSTLARLLSGLLPPTGGSVEVDGIDTRDPAQRDALRRRVGLVFQQPENQIVAQTVADEVAFGLENQNLPPARIQAKVADTLAATGLSALAGRAPAELSGGELQRLALAGLLALDPGYLLIDEPFTWLDLSAQEALFQTLLALRDQGRGIALVSQETDLLARADRVWLMGEGRLVADAAARALAAEPELFERAGLSVPPLLALGRRLAPWFPGGAPLTVAEAHGALAPRVRAASIPHNEIEPASHEISEPALRARGLGLSYPTGPERWAFRDVDLAVGAGEWLLLSGPSGCGKSSLVQTFNGLLRPQRGEVALRGESITDRGTAQLCREVGLVFQNPRQQFFADTVFGELGAALADRTPPPADLDARVAAQAARLGLTEALLAHAPQHLSGGEQLKVALGSLLLLEPDVLVLDETLASLDPPARAAVLALLSELNAQGLTLVVVTHRPAQALAQADRLIWMDRDGLTAYAPPEAPEALLPEEAQLCRRLLGRSAFGVSEAERLLRAALEAP